MRASSRTSGGANSCLPPPSSPPPPLLAARHSCGRCCRPHVLRDFAACSCDLLNRHCRNARARPAAFIWPFCSLHLCAWLLAHLIWAHLQSAIAQHTAQHSRRTNSKYRPFQCRTAPLPSRTDPSGRREAMVEAATASLAGFVYALPGQNSSALCSSRFAGPYSFTAAPLTLTADAENAFKLLSLSTLPQQVQPAQPRRQPPAAALPPPQQQQRPALHPVQPPLQQPAAGRQPILQPAQPVQQRRAAYAAAGGGQAAVTVAGTSGASAGYRASAAAGQADPDDAEDDAFYGAIDVESIVQQAASRRPAAAATTSHLPPSTQHLRQHPPGLNASTHLQQQQQQGHQQQQQRPVAPGWQAGGPEPAPTSQQLQHPPAAATGPLCSHGAPIASCPHRQLHLEDIVRQVSEVGLQFADADEGQTAALKLEMKRLRDLKHMLEAAPPLPMAAHAAGMPAGAGMQQVQQPQHHHQQHQQQHQQQYQQQHQHQPQSAQQQQQQRTYNGAQPAAGYGGGGGMSAQSFQPRPANGEYGGGFNGGGSGGFNGGSGTFGGGGGGGYEAGPPLPLWQPDAGALQGVAAEREDASGDMKWRQEAFPWSSELRQRNREAFGNKDFRANQLQIMNATLSRRDVFVLMPTGGGKSLCYQLPALLSAGVTVVVSPLVSLIQDQVHHLTVLGINAACVGGSVDWEEQRRVYASLMEADGCKVLFITPEKLAASGKLQSTLDSLHQRGLLARVCIDEAHCVSQWGHDFRKDYTRLSFFKQRFPSVPLLALTATATQRVQHDVVAQLGIQHCLMFKYEVRKKKKGCVDEMAELVLSKFTTRVQAGNKHSWSVQCGIVYCLSRAECERVADELEAQLAEGIFPLRNGRRRVKHYHASLSPEEREAVQAEWTNGDVPVIVATIAFGMGINKADVRFVFHYSLPKSLEGYLQESGRAGRDGRPSTCILYYTYGDAAKTRHMIRSSAQENGSPEEQVRSNMESLNAMINYCEEQVECRRVLMLSHFGEGGFSRSQCRATCDNCRAGEGMSYAEVDVSEAAKKVIEVVRCIGRASVAHVVDVFRGNNTVGVRKAGHGSAPVHGIGKACCRNNGEAERLVRRMVVRGYLTEETHRAEMHMAVLATLVVNEPAAARLFSGQLPMKMHVQQKGGSSGKAGASGKGRAARTPATAAAALTVTTAKTAGAAAAAPARGGAAASFGGGAVQRRQAAPAEPLVISIEDSEDDDDEELRQRTAVLAAAMKQLSTALRQHRDLPRAPLTTSVQSKIAALGFLTTLQQFMDAEVTGMSDSMKRKYGREIVAASCQAAAFLPAMLEGKAQLHEFELDLGAVFAGQKAEDAAQAKRRRETDGWSDDEDDDWVEARGCGGAPAGAPAGAAAAGAYRPQQGGAGSGRVVAGGVQAAPWPAQAQAQHQQQQHGQHQQQQHGQYHQQQGQYQGTAGGVQRPVPRPTSAGPFGRREGVSYNHASSGGQAQAAAQWQQPHLQQQQQQQPVDASPQWRHRKSGGGGGSSTHPAAVRHGQQHQQQQQGQHGRIETTVVQNITGAFGGGW
ncbi:ATP-dependent DNA helicase Q-like 4A [Chlorella vulgaris]